MASLDLLVPTSSSRISPDIQQHFAKTSNTGDAKQVIARLSASSADEFIIIAKIQSASKVDR